MSAATTRKESVEIIQFTSEYSFRHQARRERQIKDEIFNCLLSLLENKQLKYKGYKIQSALRPSVIEVLTASGWTRKDIDQVEQSILGDAEVIQEVPRNLFAELKKRSCDYLIFENRIVIIPDALLNALICLELLLKFSEVDLKLCGIFTKVRDFGIDGEICESLRIDVDSRLSRRGFFIPIIKEGLIDGLQVFRRPDDESPFKLRARADLMDFTGGLCRS
jgi:hypothetical protein